MSTSFDKTWKDTGEPEGPNKIREAIRPSPQPLRTRLNQAIRRIEAQNQRIKQAADRLEERDRTIFRKIVDAYTKHDTERSNVLANELVEIRKMHKFMLHSHLALEQVVLRLSTVSELGDVVVTLTPAASILQGIRKGVAGVLPEAERELGQVGDLLNDIILDAGQGFGMTLGFDVASEDAEKILSEAAMVADQRMKERFPEVPATIPRGRPLPAEETDLQSQSDR